MNINFSKFDFYPVVQLPSDYEVLDITGDYHEAIHKEYSIGRYNEDRPQVYQTEAFTKTQRTIHMGIDIGAPANTPVHSFYKGEVFLFDRIDRKGDYGPVLVTKHKLGSTDLYALYGHLSLSSLKNKKEGQKIAAGEVIGWLGDESVNGGWPPHVHFQLCLEEPKSADIPGVVSKADHAKALEIYPDPRLVLGPLY